MYKVQSSGRFPGIPAAKFALITLLTVSLMGATAFYRGYLTPGMPGSSKLTALRSDSAANSKPIRVKERISLTHRRYDLPPGLLNVGPEEAVYHVTEKTVLALPVDFSRIPAGYSLYDVFTYGFDARSKQWAPLERDSIDVGRGIVYTRALKEGDYINGVMQAPEAPETNAFVPTTVRDIKAADPGAQVQLITPPTANIKGNASLSYQIETPKGRQGIEPSLQVTYNSDAGNGLLGQGWSLSGISAISVDTRWGVPEYDQHYESETYMLDGQMLAFMDSLYATVPHRNFNGDGTLRKVPRRDVTRFYPRREQDFRQIVRLGNTPDNCSWVITDMKGVKYYYGTTPASRLSANGKIAEWRICRVEDLHGNSMEYKYRNDHYILPENPETCYNLVIDSIIYTRLDNAVANYRPNYYVAFFNNPNRNDININARYGFLTGNRMWLDSIRISYREWMPDQRTDDFRTYVFSPGKSAFNQTVLMRITQKGIGGGEFNHHDFSYYNEVADGKMFDEPADFTIGSDGLGTDVPNPGNFLPTSPTAIGTTKSHGNGGKFYVGLGPNDFNPVTKSNTAGVHGSYTVSKSDGVNALVDIDADGLPDKVFVKEERLYYRKNLGNRFHNTPIFLINAPHAFFEQQNKTFSIGGQSNFFEFGGVDYSKTSSETSAYFVDVNADGWMDIVSDGNVYFNYPENGIPTFSGSSERTAVPMSSGSTAGLFPDAASLQAEQERIRQKKLELIRENPLNDVVRMWEAPFGGVVNIKAPVTQQFVDVASLSSAEKKEFDKADGLQVSIQVGNGNTWLESHHFNKNDPSPNFDFPVISAADIIVKKGTRIYFRVRSAISSDGNGAFDEVSWKPEIIYKEYDTTKRQNDVFNRNKYKYAVAEDHLVSRKGESINIPANGTLNIRSTITKKPSNDSVNFTITHIKTEEELQRVRNPVDSVAVQICEEETEGAFKSPFPGLPDSVFVCPCIKISETCQMVRNPVDSFDVLLNSGRDTIISVTGKRNVPLNRNVNLSIPVDSGDVIAFTVTSAANTDLSVIDWKPKVWLTDASGSNSPAEYIVPEYIFNDTLLTTGAPPAELRGRQYTIKPWIRFRDNTGASGDISFTVRNNDLTLHSQKLRFEEGQLQMPVSFKSRPNLTGAVREYYSTFENPAVYTDAASDALLSRIDTAYYIIGFTDSLEATTDGHAGTQWIAPESGWYIFTHHLQFKNPTNRSIRYELNGKTDTLFYAGSVLHQPRADTFYIAKGKMVLLNYSNFNVDGLPVTLPRASIETARGLISAVLPAQVWNKRKAPIFGAMYRGWGQFIYGGGFSGYNDKIDEDALRVARKDVNEQMSDNTANSVNGQVARQDAENEPELSVLDGFSPMKNALILMLPVADTSATYFWKGQDDAVFLKKETASASRWGLKDMTVQSPFLDAAGTPRNTAGSFAAIGIVKIGSARSWSFNLGAGPVSASYATGSSDTESDFLDVNGDLFPDILRGQHAQVTLPNGRLNKAWGSGIQNSSSNKTFGGGYGGSFPHAMSIFSLFNRTASGASSTRSATQGKDADGAAKSATQFVGVQPGSGNFGNEETQATWMDVNGDGLADKLTKAGDQVNIALNLGGGRFTAPVRYGLGQILKGGSINLSPASLGFNIGNGSITAGAGLSLSHSLPDRSLRDVNGDGLPDAVTIENGQLKVQVNTGTGLLNEAGWYTFPIGSIPALPPLRGIVADVAQTWNANFNSSIGQSFSLGYTHVIFIPACLGFPCIKLAISAGFDHSRSAGKVNRELMDINGDGYADLLESGKEDQLKVRYSRIGATHKLRTVTNPMGGTFTIAYKRSEPTDAHPGGKWIMEKLTVNDGRPEDGNPRLDSFIYSKGKYDRYEREFLGFGYVSTANMDSDKPIPDIYRKITQHFDVDNYYVAGNLKEQWQEDKDGRQYEVARNNFLLEQVLPDRHNAGNFAHLPFTHAQAKFYSGICFTAVTYSTKGTHEGNNAQFVGNHTLYNYSPQGHVTDFYYGTGDTVTTSSFSYHTRIRYKPFDPATGIYGLPEEQITEAADGSLHRKNISGYSTEGQMIRLRQLLDNSAGERFATTSFEYYKDGNIRSKTLPPNARGETVAYNYRYDAETNIFISEVQQSAGQGFNFTSKTKTDHRFGVPLMITDIHGREIRYTLDPFGRVVEIIAPHQSANHPFTIKFGYAFNAQQNPATYAKTTHYDDSHPGMQTITFTDGFKRLVQTKKTAVVEGNQDAKWIVSGRINYDAMGRQIAGYHPFTDNDEDGSIFRNSYPPGIQPTRYKYDVADRITEVKLADDAIRNTTTYRIRSGACVQTQTFYNASGNQVKELMTDGSRLKIMESYNGIETRYYYDPILQLKRIIDYDSRPVYYYEYDLAGRRTLLQSLSAGNSTLQYDDAGNLIQRTNSDGHQIRYEFDYNRLVAILYPSHPENNVKYTYGTGDNTGADENRNRVIYQEDASGAQSFTYDIFGNVQTNTRTIISPFDASRFTFTTTFEYDVWNRMRSIRYPDNDVVKYIYNHAGLLQSMVQERPAGGTQDTLVAHIGYDAFEQRVVFRYGNNTVARYTYEPERRRLASVINVIDGKTSRQAFTYDNLDNIILLKDDVANNLVMNAVINRKYTYDNANRLTKAVNSWTEPGPSQPVTSTMDFTYSKDFSLAGRSAVYANPRQNVTRSYSERYQHTGHQLKTVNRESDRTQKGYRDEDGTPRDLKYHDVSEDAYEFDSKGNNTLKSTSETFGNYTAGNTNIRKVLWDDENRIKAISVDGLVSSYIYDAGGNRSIKISTRSFGDYVNGVKAGDSTIPASFSLYAGPYLSMRNGAGAYSKHYYIGNERIASQLENDAYFRNDGPGGGGALPTLANPATCNNTFNAQCQTADYPAKAAQINTVINGYYQKMDLPFRPVVPGAFTEKPAAPAVGPLPAEGNHALRYFYHTDQVRSTSQVTDISGRTVHFAAYLPYGELLEERQNGYSSQFMFNGKEQDKESGLFYYGARYYDPVQYQWMSIDPMAEKYPGLSPYNFSLGNPVRFIDPDGMDVLTTEEDRNSHGASMAVYDLTDDKEKEQAKSRLGDYERTAHYSPLKFSDENTGFKAALFLNKKTGRYILAFRGTVNLDDWKQNLLQTVGLGTQDDDAIGLAKALHQQLGDRLDLTGHSKGGAQAEQAALVTGLKAITFNPARPSALSIMRYNGKLSNAGNITSHVMVSDPLNIGLETIRREYPLLMPLIPPSLGNKQYHIPPATWNGWLNGHSITNF